MQGLSVLEGERGRRGEERAEEGGGGGVQINRHEDLMGWRGVK